jgi:hypothetical protein
MRTTFRRSNFSPCGAPVYRSFSINQKAGRVYALLSENGEIFMPTAETFFYLAAPGPPEPVKTE